MLKYVSQLKKGEKMKNVSLKYKLKTMVLKLQLRKLSSKEMEDLSKCVTEAVAFWANPLSEGNVDEKKINDFKNYLTINTLYSLIVKKSEYVYIHKSWDPLEGLAESVYDSGVSNLYLPIKTHMDVYRDKVIVDGEMYYTLECHDNESNKLEITDKTRIKSLNELIGVITQK